MPRRILVIGGLAAGPSAASKAARVDPAAEVVLLEQGEHVSYGICEIPYFLAGEVQAEGLVAYTPGELKEKKRVDARVRQRVEEIMPRRHGVRVRNLKTGAVREERYDKLIIATGSSPRTLGVPGEDASNVFHIKTLEGAFRLKEFIKSEHPSRAVIAGAGYIGIELADALRSQGIEVTMLHQYELPMSGMEDITRREVHRVLTEHGVNFRGSEPPEKFVVDGNRVRLVSTCKGSYEADLVILAVGVAPSTAIAKQAGIRLGVSGGILTDQRQQTSEDDIYAAGDCCEVKNLINNRRMFLPLATIASKQGWVAGENAAGGSARFAGVIRAIAVRAFTSEIAHVGLSIEEALDSRFDPISETISSWSRVAVMQGSKRVSVTLIADRRSGRLLGANLFGEEGAVLRANTLAVGIQHGLTLDSMRQWDLAYSPPFTPLWDPLLVAANALSKKL